MRSLVTPRLLFLALGLLSRFAAASGAGAGSSLSSAAPSFAAAQSGPKGLLQRLALAVARGAGKSKRWAARSAFQKSRSQSQQRKKSAAKVTAAAGACGAVPCPDVSFCQPVNGAPSCSCNPFLFSRLLNNKCSAAPLLHWGYLDPHNSARAATGSGPLSWNNQLASQAQSWANFLASSNNCQLAIGGISSGVGQNVANWFRNPAVRNVDAMKIWVQAGARYSYSVFQPFGAAGCNTGNWQDCATYTQVVWNKTQFLGCGVAFCPASLGKVWVCNYFPAGNVQGQFPYNLP